MQQNHAVDLVVQRQHPVQCGIAGAGYDHVLAGEQGRVADLVVQVAALDARRAIDIQQARPERAHAARNDHRSCVELRPGAGSYAESAGRLPADVGDFLAEMELRRERLDLLHQPIDEFARVADRNRRDVVDRLVGIKLDALAADVRHAVDDLCLEVEQPEFKDLEQADGARTDDDDVRNDHALFPLGRPVAAAFPG